MIIITRVRASKESLLIDLSEISNKILKPFFPHHIAQPHDKWHISVIGKNFKRKEKEDKHNIITFIITCNYGTYVCIQQHRNAFKILKPLE